jgi:4-hydroxybenzoate polyprenyltransferase
MAGGRKTAVLATGLAAAIWTYDVKWKNTGAGPAGMALCRGLDVLMGASTGRVRKAVRPAAIVAAHTYAVTALSRREVHGADRLLPLTTLTATALIASAAAVESSGQSASAGQRRSPGGLGSWMSAVLAGWYAARFGKAQRNVLLAPHAGNVRAAVGAGITSLPALQGALIAHTGRPVTGGLVAAAAPLGARLIKAVAAT